MSAMMQLSLIFGNLTADDILLKDELDAMAAKFPQRVKVCDVPSHTQPDACWVATMGMLACYHKPSSRDTSLLCPVASHTGRPKKCRSP